MVIIIIEYNLIKNIYTADKIGMEIAARACFDPSEAIR